METKMGLLWFKRNAIGLLGGASLWLTTSCGVDLGKCDTAQLGESTSAVNFGQSVVQTSCAGGRCHTETATGKNRYGAPAGLNFDVVLTDGTSESMARVARGTKKVQDSAEQMWGLVDSGDMPPKGVSSPLLAADKEKLRNWLACGAKVVQVQSAPVTADWESIYPVLANNCLGCHSSMSSAAARAAARASDPPTGVGFSLGDPGDMCAAYNAVVSKMSVTDLCKASGLTLVMPEQPAMSFLVQKLKGTQTCGASMPAGAAMPFAANNADVVAKLEQWITAGAIKPASCP